LTRDLNVNQATISARLVSLTSSLDSLTREMQHGQGTMAQLVRSPELYNHLMSSTARLDSILAVVESGKGTFGRMMSDTLLYDDTKAMVASMKRSWGRSRRIRRSTSSSASSENTDGPPTCAEARRRAVRAGSRDPRYLVSTSLRENVSPAASARNQ
jgi:hypothetical protein